MTTEPSTLVLYTRQGHSGWLTGVSISHDGSQAVTTSGDGMALLWDLITGKQLRALEGHSAEVTASLLTRKSRCAQLCSCKAYTPKPSIPCQASPARMK